VSVTASFLQLKKFLSALFSSIGFSLGVEVAGLVAVDTSGVHICKMKHFLHVHSEQFFKKY